MTVSYITSKYQMVAGQNHVRPNETVNNYFFGGSTNPSNSNGKFATATLQNGAVTVSGDINYGGDSSTVSTFISSNVDLLAVVAEGGFVAVKNDGSIKSWGNAGNISDTSVVQIAVSMSGWAALKSDGTIISAGEKPVGSNFVKVFAGGYGCYAALTDQGSLITWGYLSGSNVPIDFAPSGDLSTGIIDVAFDYGAGIALKNDGSMVTWAHPGYRAELIAWNFGANHAPTGSPNINGTAEQGQILTANTSAIADSDGLGTMNYQWMRAGSAISGATQSTYTATASDVNSSISVSVSYTDGLGKVESLTSSSISIATPTNYPPSGSVTILGTAQQNQTVTATNTLTDPNGLGTIHYSWLSNGTVISNQPSYVLTQNEVGKSISVSASYTDDLGKLESVSSSSITVSNMNDSPTGFVSIYGETKVGQTLSISNSLADADGLGSINYQWLSNGAMIYGSTTSTYTLTASDIGKAFSVRASYTDLQGKSENVTSSATALIVTPTNYPPGGNLSVTGTPQLNQTLLANNTLTDANVLGTMNYQWSANGSPISGANQVTYTTTASDAGKAIAVTASYIDGLGKPESVTSPAVTIAQPPTLPTGSVTISGTAQPNQTLTASHTLADVNGLGAISYQWLANGTAISGATQNTYALKTDDVGKSITVTASYTDGLNKPESVSSSSVTGVYPQTPPTGTVTITGKTQPSETLSITNTLADVNGLGAMNYQWLASSVAMTGATQSTYNLLATDAGKSISVTASYTDGLGKLESATSPAVTISQSQMPPTGNITITGKSQPNETLFVNSTLADVNGLGTFNYQWTSNSTPISNANQVAYALTSNDSGKNIGVTVNYTDGLGKLESVNSSPVLVVSGQTPPTGKVEISGTPQPNQTLFVNNTLADVNSLGAMSYQWLSNNVAISGANQVVYSVTTADAGKNLSVTASYTDGLGKLESIASASVAITYPQTAPTGKVTISGTPQPNQALTANSSTLADVNGLGKINYQWLRDDVAISGATQPTYITSTNDAGKKISITASYIDGLNKPESVTSNVLAVDYPQIPPTGDVIITGIAQPNQTLSVKNTLADVNGLGSFNYQWLRDGVAISGTNKNSYVVKTDDADKEISVKVSYTDGLKKLESVTSDSVIISVNHPPVGNLIINGSLQTNRVLSIFSNLSDQDDLGGFSYQWLANGKVIKNAIQDTYKLVKTDVGKKISVKINYTDGNGNVETVTSTATTPIKKGIAIDGVTPITKPATTSIDKLIGTAKNDELVGLAGNDSLIGNAGNDLLDGGDGNDSLDGGNGNDELTGGDGNDTLMAGSGNDLLDGGKGDDKLVGDKGNDTLQGGVGVDNMDGGAGDDYYIVDNIKDAVTEAKSAGTDSIESTQSYTLGKNVENLVLAGILDNAGTGNELNNTITGNVGDNKLVGGAGNDKLVGEDGADTLDGGLGMDTLIGGADDDTYSINNLEDKISEGKNGGKNDQILSTVNYNLTTSPNVEILTLSGVKAINGTGDEFDNLLQEIDGGKVANSFNGAAGNDTINGEDGSDTLEGGEGNDIIDGGVGDDIAIFTGSLDNYLITRNSDTEGVDQLVVKYVGNLENGEIDEGIDILTNVEILQFANDDTRNVREIDVTDSSAMLVLTGVVV